MGDFYWDGQYGWMKNDESGCAIGQVSPSQVLGCLICCPDLKLHIIFIGNNEAAELFIEKGANVNSVNENNVPALILAASDGNMSNLFIWNEIFDFTVK